MHHQILEHSHVRAAANPRSAAAFREPDPFGRILVMQRSQVGMAEGRIIMKSTALRIGRCARSQHRRGIADIVIVVVIGHNLSVKSVLCQLRTQHIDQFDLFTG
ncbi:hypothetical protein D3C71_1976000 [compost metagenome]